MLPGQVAHRNAGIDVQHAHGAGGQTQDEHLQEEQPVAPVHIYDHVKKITGQVEPHGAVQRQGQHGQDGGRHRKHVQQHRHNQLGSDMLGHTGGQGEHQVSLVPQQIFGKALDLDDQGQHEGSHKEAEAQGAHRHSDDIIERGAEPLQVPQQEVGQHRRQDQAAIHGDTHPRDRLPLVSNQFAQHANTSRNRVSTDLPVSSRMASTSLCRTMTPSRIKTTSSSTRSMSAIRWVESRTLASSL